MATGELALRITFYLYPCLLFVALLGVQSFQFYRNRGRDARRNASDDKDKHDAESIRRFHARLIWFLQLVLSFLLLASIIVTAREAVAGRHDGSGKVDFPFSAYLVRARPFSLSLIVFTDTLLRRLMSEFFCTSRLASSPTRRARGPRPSLTASRG